MLISQPPLAEAPTSHRAPQHCHVIIGADSKTGITGADAAESIEAFDSDFTYISIGERGREIIEGWRSRHKEVSWENDDLTALVALKAMSRCHDCVKIDWLFMLRTNLEKELAIAKAKVNHQQDD